MLVVLSILAKGSSSCTSNRAKAGGRSQPFCAGRSRNHQGDPSLRLAQILQLVCATPRHPKTPQAGKATCRCPSGLPGEALTGSQISVGRMSGSSQHPACLPDLRVTANCTSSWYFLLPPAHRGTQHRQRARRTRGLVDRNHRTTWGLRWPRALLGRTKVAYISLPFSGLQIGGRLGYPTILRLHRPACIVCSLGVISHGSGRPYGPCFAIWKAWSPAHR